MTTYNIRKLRSGRIADEDPNNWVGQLGTIFYNEATGALRISDGVTPGGVNLPFAVATTTELGGIKAGPGANVSVDGTLTIDTSGLPLTIGNVQIIDNAISAVNTDADIIIESNGSGNVELVGNVNFYTTLAGADGPPYFIANQDGQITIKVPAADPAAGAVKIVGSQTGFVFPPLNTGVMLQLTGNNNDPSRLYNDGINNFPAFVGRRINGNITVPTAVVAGDDLLRISVTGHNGVTVPGSGSGRILFQALETHTPTAAGSNISIWTTPIGSNVLTKTATFDSANGFTVTKANVQGTLTVGGAIVPSDGNDIGSPDVRWGNIWLGATAIHMQDTISNVDVALQVTNGTLYLNGVENIAVGNLVINDTTLKTISPDLDIKIGELPDSGNVNIFRPLNIYDSSGSLRFNTTRLGLTTIYAPTIAANTVGAFSINGSTGKNYQPVQFAGGLLHLTSNDNQPARLTSDAFGVNGGVSTYAQFTGRSGRGNVSTPSALQTDDTMLRITSVGWGATKFPTTPAPTGIEFAAAENYTDTAYGSKINFYTAPLGTNTKTLTTSISASTGMTVYGNVTAGNVLGTNGTFTNFTGKHVRNYRDAGVIADGGAVLINFATDSIIKCEWDNIFTINYTGFTPGSVVKFIAYKRVGTGTDSLSLDGITAGYVSTGSTTVAGTGGIANFIEFTCTGTTLSTVFAEVT